jgi:dolichol-phosphate mannosyltransferase
MTTPGATSDRREGDVDLTIVIPCLNEEDNIRLVLDELRVVLRNRPFASEIVVVDDLSEDRTFAVAAEWANSAGQDFRVSVVKRPLHRRGYGAAVRYGVAYGVGRYAIFRVG